MASKRLAAFLEMDDAPVSVSQGRAVSADSAKSPPECPERHPIGTNGTNGTDEQNREPPVAADSPDPAEHDLGERAALIELGAKVPRGWAEGYAALCSLAPPTRFSPERWDRIVDGAGAFLHRWAVEAIAAGWTDLDVFGCDPNRSGARLDCIGILMLLELMEIVSIDPGGAALCSRTGSVQRYRRRPLPTQTVSLWDLTGGRVSLMKSQASRRKDIPAQTSRGGPAESTDPEGSPK